MRRIGSTVLFVGLCAVLAVASAAGRPGKRPKPKPAPPPLVDINRAGVKDFEKLPGIGPEIARRIVTYRAKHGPFRRTEDLLAIRGIGPKKWQAMRPYLRVSREGGKHKSSR